MYLCIHNVRYVAQQNIVPVQCHPIQLIKGYLSHMDGMPVQKYDFCGHPLHSLTHCNKSTLMYHGHMPVHAYVHVCTHDSSIWVQAALRFS